MRLNELSADISSRSRLKRSASVGRAQIPNTAECSLISVGFESNSGSGVIRQERSARLLVAGQNTGFPFSSTLNGAGRVRPFCKLGKKTKVPDSKSDSKNMRCRKR